MSEPPPRPVLILSADVGEGHLAAARALGEHLTARGVPSVHQDGLVALGRIACAVIRDGYRLQLRVAPWSYNIMYTIFNKVAPLRLAGGALLCRLGRRRLLRTIAREDPAVIVSTHPAITAVLGRLRRHRRLAVPVVAPITDLADYDVWSHPGADLHLVMHPDALPAVERVAGPGSAILVEPLVAPRFRQPRNRPRARQELGLPAAGRLVAVSGGGWGVGDLAGGATAALAAGAAGVVIVCGRNDAAHADLTQRFAQDPRVRVWGFTDNMDTLMRAADALVHSTGGVTSLEALACGCPMIAYGATAGHIKVHNTTMQRLGLIDVAHDTHDLTAKLSVLLDGGRAPWQAPPEAADAAAVVAAALPRIRPLPLWRTAMSAAVLPVALVTLAGGALGTDIPYNMAAQQLELRPVTHLGDTAHRVGVVLRSSGATDAALVARALGPNGPRVTFAVPARQLAATEAAVAPAGDDAIAALSGSEPVAWVTTRRALDHDPEVDGRRYYLAPDHGRSVGQYLLAQSAHATGLAGQVRLDPDDPVSEDAAATAGGILVVDAAGSPAATARTIVALSRSLSARGLRASALSSLLAARTAGAASSISAEPTTTATPSNVNHG